MNIKKFYGVFLAIFGIVGLGYAILSLVSSKGLSEILVLVIYGILGVAFLLAGISLVKAIKDRR